MRCGIANTAKAAVGQIVSVTFIDHHEDADEPLHCQVFGLLVKAQIGSESPYLIIDSWIDLDYPDSENRKRWVILLSVVDKIETLHFVKGKS